MATHLITGAGSGIGAALAQQLHARGDRLVLLARTWERATELAERYAGVQTVVADLGHPESVESLVLPDSLDSVVHAAGVVELAAVSDQSVAHWAEQLRVNLVAPAALTRQALPALRSARGTVVFVNSTAGLSASPHWSAYAASKHGLRALADSLRAEESGAGLRVTTVFPSRTATPMQEKVHRQEGRDYDADAWIRPETVADQIVRVLDLPRDATIAEVTIRPA